MGGDSPAFKFFWKSNEERAFAKLDGTESSVYTTLAVNQIKVDKSIKNPIHLCQICGSHLPERFCKNCTELNMLDDMNLVYFVVDHFEGDDYTVVFLVNKEGPPENLYNHGKSQVSQQI